MAKVRSALLEQGVFVELPSLASLLDFVAVATIADCVSLSPGASLINRAFLRRGMQQVRSGCRPCWKVFSAEVDGEIDAETIAFRRCSPLQLPDGWIGQRWASISDRKDEEDARHVGAS